jgi:hypothetical protein
MSHKRNIHKRTRPWGAKIHTIDTIDVADVDGSIPSSANKQSDINASQLIKIQHIPSLTSSEYAENILKRIKNEFTEIIRKRGYNITSGKNFFLKLVTMKL